jgi:hypothetical protein
MSTITQKKLREIINYDPKTGIFIWIKRPHNASFNSRRGGTRAGCINTIGYSVIRVFDKLHHAHRLAWLYMTGTLPENNIDHINGVRSDNRFINLRDVDQCCNMQNIKKSRVDSATGVLGITPHGSGFMARIRTQGKYLYLGTFKTPQLAHAAYLSAKRKVHAGNTL